VSKNIDETTKQPMDMVVVALNEAKDTSCRHIFNEIGNLVHKGCGFRMERNSFTAEEQATNKQLLDSEFSGNKNFIPMVSIDFYF
jgi:hypothetical protein